MATIPTAKPVGFVWEHLPDTMQRSRARGPSTLMKMKPMSLGGCSMSMARTDETPLWYAELDRRGTQGRQIGKNGLEFTLSIRYRHEFYLPISLSISYCFCSINCAQNGAFPAYAYRRCISFILASMPQSAPHPGLSGPSRPPPAHCSLHPDSRQASSRGCGGETR